MYFRHKKVKYTVSKNGMPVMHGDPDICNQSGKANAEAVKQLALVGFPTHCPIAAVRQLLIRNFWSIDLYLNTIVKGSPMRWSGDQDWRHQVQKIPVSGQRNRRCGCGCHPWFGLYLKQEIIMNICYIMFLYIFREPLAWRLSLKSTNNFHQRKPLTTWQHETPNQNTCIIWLNVYSLQQIILVSCFMNHYKLTMVFHDKLIIQWLFLFRSGVVKICVYGEVFFFWSKVKKLKKNSILNIFIVYEPTMEILYLK